MTNSRSHALLILIALTLAACADKRWAQSTTVTTPDFSARPRALDLETAAIGDLQVEHNRLVKFVNEAGLPSADWTVPRLELYRERLTRLEKLEDALARRDQIYAAEMRRDGHADRVAVRRRALDEVFRPAPEPRNVTAGAG